MLRPCNQLTIVQEIQSLKEASTSINSFRRAFFFFSSFQSQQELGGANNSFPNLAYIL